MKKLKFILLSVISISCSSGKETQATDRLIVQKGKDLTIYLKSHSTTGYSWHLVNDPSLLDSTSKRY